MNKVEKIEENRYKVQLDLTGGELHALLHALRTYPSVVAEDVYHRLKRAMEKAGVD